MPPTSAPPDVAASRRSGAAPLSSRVDRRLEGMLAVVVCLIQTSGECEKARKNGYLLYMGLNRGFNNQWITVLENIVLVRHELYLFGRRDLSSHVS